METIKGKVKNYVFHNKENSYSIARVITEDDKQITIVGYFPIVSEDVDYQFGGSWINHSSYGKQLKIETYKKCEQQSKSGLISYLSSSIFHGIGPKTAEKIVGILGEDAINKIIEDKLVLRKVGLTAIRVEKFYQQLKENQLNEHILVTLYGYDLSAKLSMKLISKYKTLTIEKLEENPYRLIDDIEGVGFLKADEIANKLGIPKDDIRRNKAAIVFAMQNIAYKNGDLYLTDEQIRNYALNILGTSSELDVAIEQLLSESKLILEEERYYLTISYFTELSLANKINKFIDQTDLVYDKNHVVSLLDVVEKQKQITYTQTQKETIIKAVTNPISIITGGPGTGKTTIIDGILDVYRIYHNLNYKETLIEEKIGLMAPTGRAAKRMKELLGMEAKTIHRHLGYNYDGTFKFDEKNMLPYDLIVIDEASMIDLFLAKNLFSAIDPKCQIVIVGDVDQLPSVGPGQVLADFIKAKTIPLSILTEIHRQAENSKIVELAQSVNNQNLMNQDLNTANDVFLYRAQPNKIIQVVINQIKGALDKGYSMIEDIQVLVPMYKGELGIDNFNKHLQKVFNPNQDKEMVFGDKIYFIGDKVIQLVNDPKNLIMNGDIGIVKAIDYNLKNNQYMIVSFDDNDVMYEKADLEELNLAYAISIHKSQGSEYKIVILPMTRNYLHMLKKELIYTAITRAKEYLIVLGDMNLLVYAANKRTKDRQTTLANRLNGEISVNETDNEDELSPYDFM